jgi:4-hydroxy-tetrahydrodipicolinate synthase
MICSGIYTALITPFDASGALDAEGLRFLVRRQCEAGIDGLVALGTTGEAPTLSAKEKERVIQIVREEGEHTDLMVGCGAYSTTQTLENILCAADLGADYALVITPFYNKPTQEGVFRHFEALCEKTPIPIMLYNNPTRTGMNIDVPTLEKIAELPGMIGVKETSGNLPQFSDILYTIKLKRPEFSVMSGDDNVAYAAMALGADGVISGVSNILPKTMLLLAEACQDENFEVARQLNLALTPLFKALLVETNPIPLKTLHNLLQLPAGSPRLPLTPLSPHFFPVLEETLSILSPFFRSECGQTESPFFTAQ